MGITDYHMLYWHIEQHPIRYSPHYLVYGQELRLPVEDDLRILNRKSNPGNYKEHVIDLVKRLRQVSEAVSQEKGEGMRAFKERS